jgi:DHA1 family inner membrane transport protein
MHHTGTKTNAGLALSALAVGGFAIGTTEFATMSLLPLFAKGLGIDAPTAGHAISAYALGVVVGAPLFAVLAARIERRRLLVLLMAMFAICNGLSALSPNYYWLLAFRFLSGLPHGAYFGFGALMASSLVPENRRTVAVGRMFLGLTFATIVGVPLSNWLGHMVGWRWSFGFAAMIGVLTMVCVRLFAPLSPVAGNASPLRELSALGRPQVWLTLGIGAIGFGGFFAVYTYLANILAAVTNVDPQMAGLVLSVFGIGMTLGNIVVPAFADRALMRTVGWLLVWSMAALLVFPFAAGNIWTITADVFLIGVGGALGTVLQTRLMDVAEDAQGLAAALNHSAFNTANALGPLLGGMAIAYGLGWTSPGWVGALLAVGGMAIWAWSSVLDKRSQAMALATEKAHIE